VDARTFLGLEATDDPNRWHLPVVPGLSTGGDFLFGGCGLAAACTALEIAADRPTIWATAQFLSFARTHEVVDLDVNISVSGHQITQARAVGRVGEREIFTVNAALGLRDFPFDGEFAEMPEVPGPEECTDREYRFPDRETILNRLDQRVAVGRSMADFKPKEQALAEGAEMGTGRSALWVRLPSGLETGTAALAILGDYVPYGIREALGIMGGGNSLDNTIRIAHLVPTEWVLLDIRVHAIWGGFGHGLVHLWAEDGTLLATASQSAIVRFWEGEGAAVQRQSERQQPSA
jgi:acyl-CoA thioesterase